MKGSIDITASTEGELTNTGAEGNNTQKKGQKAHLFEGFRQKESNGNCKLTRSSTILLLMHAAYLREKQP